MEILFTCHRYSPLIGGYETQVKLLAENLSNSVNVKVITFKLIESSCKDVSDRVEVYRVKPRLVFFRIPFSFAFTRLLNKLPFDVLNAHGTVPFISDISLIHAKLRQKSTVYTHHFDGNVQDSKGLDAFANFYNSTMGRFCASYADAIVTTSKSYAETSETIKPYMNRVHIIPCSVDTTVFEPQSKTAVDSLRKLHGLSAKKVILFVGRIVPYKGLEYLVEALRYISEVDNDFHLLIVGEGEGRHITDKSSYLQKIQASASEKGLKNNVHFLGRVSGQELPIYYSLADVVVLPSVMRGEAFGSVLIEALACGTPVVASNLPGVKDVLRGNCTTGSYVSAGDSRALSQATVRMAYMKNDVTEDCRKFAVDNYRIEKIAEEYIDLYASLN